jgi:hypothetical protein
MEPVPWRADRIRLALRRHQPGAASRVCKALSKRCHHALAFPKISTILLRRRHSLFEKGEFPMRLGQAILFGSAAALLTLAAPTLARNSSAHSHTAKATEAPRPPPAMPTSRRPTVPWTQLPCQEMGAKAQQSKSASKPATEETR